MVILVLRRSLREAVEQRSRGQRLLQGRGAVRRTSVHAGTYIADVGIDFLDSEFGAAAGAHKQGRLRRRTRRSSPAPHANQACLLRPEIFLAVAAADQSGSDKHSSLDHAAALALLSLANQSPATHHGWRCRDVMIHLIWVVQTCCGTWLVGHKRAHWTKFGGPCAFSPSAYYLLVSTST